LALGSLIVLRCDRAFRDMSKKRIGERSTTHSTDFVRVATRGAEDCGYGHAATAWAVKLPDNERVTVPKRLQACSKARSVGALQRHVTGADTPLDCRGGRAVELERLTEHI
jgi:hypothetical protein